MSTSTRLRLRAGYTTLENDKYDFVDLCSGSVTSVLVVQRCNVATYLLVPFSDR
jgi:hypothetical protein